MRPDYDIVTGSREEAEQTLNAMKEILSEYGFVTVADMYDLMDLVPTYTESKYGWTSLRDVYVARVRHGYTLTLPMPTLIEMGTCNDAYKAIDANEPLVRMVHETENEFVQRINARLEEGKLTPNAARKSMGLSDIEAKKAALRSANQRLLDLERTQELYKQAVEALNAYAYGNPHVKDALDKKVEDILKSWGL